MSAITFYEITVPVFRRFLTHLQEILDYAEREKNSLGLTEAEIVGARLAPDMFTLGQQVMVATFHATLSFATLKGEEQPKLPEDVESFAGLRERIAATFEYLDGVGEDDVNGAEDKEVEYPLFSGPRRFTGRTLLLNHCIPNFFFHVSTAYGLLRHKGYQIKKRDFLGMTKPGEEE